MNRSNYLIAFLAVSFLHLTAISLHWDPLVNWTKSLIVISLIGHYFSTTSVISFSFVLALIFCCFGDTFLLFQAQNELFFMAGLGSFLVGHFFYILSYRQHCSVSPNEKPGTLRIRLAFPIVLSGTSLVVILMPRLGDLKVPVIIYSLLLTLMVVSAIFRRGFTNNRSFWKVFIGAALFMISDSVLAINKFLSPVVDGSFWIMASYCIAQVLIVDGIVDHHGRKLIN